MCRLLLGSYKGIKLYHKRYDITNLLSHLERELGGNGNGLVLIKDNIIKFYKKGVKYHVNEIGKTLIREEYDYAIFHTRLASIGEVIDSNCHPYVYENTCLSMSGTIIELAEEAINRNITDTEIIFESVKNLELSNTINILKSFNSCSFIGCVNGTPYVIRGSHTIYKWNSKHTLFASTFPVRIKASPLTKNQIWIGG